MAIPELPGDEYDALCAFDAKADLFDQLEATHGLTVPSASRRAIADTLYFYADHLRNKREVPLEKASRRKLVVALDRLFKEFDEQRSFAVPDPRRAGYEEFVQASQRGYSESESDRRTHAIIGGRDPGPPGLCRDEFSDFYDAQDGRYSSLGERRGWLETLLAKIRDDLAAEPIKGQQGKERDFLIQRLARVYQSTGGAITANYQESKGKVDGPFVRFVVDILEACPPVFKRYVRPGIEDAIRDWIRLPKRERSWSVLELTVTRNGLAWHDFAAGGNSDD